MARRRKIPDFDRFVTNLDGMDSKSIRIAIGLDDIPPVERDQSEENAMQLRTFFGEALRCTIAMSEAERALVDRMFGR